MMETAPWGVREIKITKSYSQSQDGTQKKLNTMAIFFNGPEEAFNYPPSVQSDLFCYLTPEQQEYVRPVLRVLKKRRQMELCQHLMDYLETGEAVVPHDVTLGAIFLYLTHCPPYVGDPAPDDPRILRPVRGV